MVSFKGIPVGLLYFFHDPHSTTSLLADFGSSADIPKGSQQHHARHSQSAPPARLVLSHNEESTRPLGLFSFVPSLYCVFFLPPQFREKNPPCREKAHHPGGNPKDRPREIQAEVEEKRRLAKEERKRTQAEEESKRRMEKERAQISPFERQLQPIRTSSSEAQRPHQLKICPGSMTQQAESRRGRH